MAKAVSRGNDGVEILFQIKNLTKKNNLVLNKATGHPWLNKEYTENMYFYLQT